jgi:hypothetical protein
MTFLLENVLWFAIAGAIVIVALGIYAGLLLGKLKKQNDAKNSVLNERVKNINLSINTICDATAQQQCSISEATVRIVTLLQVHPLLAGKYDEQLPQMNNFYKAIEHHPILENRKNTPKKVLHKLDQEREDLEAQYETQILSELKWLRGKNL